MKKLLFFLLSMTLCLSSCSKDNSDDPIIEEPTAQSHKGHEYVDLGLPSGTFWATCNVGANKPEDYGDYFAWAEITSKKSYKWSNLQYCEIKGDEYDYILTKYCTDAEYGKVDNKKVLDSSDDAAQTNWGGKWRMPTKEDAEELLNECTWIWTTEKGVKGCKLTSKKNGNSIFLPAAGRCGGDDDIMSDMEGIWVMYWTSSLNDEEPDCAYEFGYDSDLKDYPPCCDYSTRCNGFSVRAVCKI